MKIVDFMSIVDSSLQSIDDGGFINLRTKSVKDGFMFSAMARASEMTNLENRSGVFIFYSSRRECYSTVSEGKLETMKLWPLVERVWRELSTSVPQCTMDVDLYPLDAAWVLKNAFGGGMDIETSWFPGYVLTRQTVVSFIESNDISETYHRLRKRRGDIIMPKDFGTLCSSSTF